MLDFNYLPLPAFAAGASAISTSPDLPLPPLAAPSAALAFAFSAAAPPLLAPPVAAPPLLLKAARLMAASFMAFPRFSSVHGSPSTLHLSKITLPPRPMRGTTMAFSSWSSGTESASLLHTPDASSVVFAGGGAQKAIVGSSEARSCASCAPEGMPRSGRRALSLLLFFRGRLPLSGASPPTPAAAAAATAAAAACPPSTVRPCAAIRASRPARCSSSLPATVNGRPSCARAAEAAYRCESPSCRLRNSAMYWRSASRRAASRSAFAAASAPCARISRALASSTATSRASRLQRSRRCTIAKSRAAASRFWRTVYSRW
mmetsp:Transcript_9427/g.38672  ORF Transcript_9427/g.38672 Transcript_9427/m.38672 type:complete len:318 (-) Transcript_9427:824-1777(-)